MENYCNDYEKSNQIYLVDLIFSNYSKQSQTQLIFINGHEDLHLMISKKQLFIMGMGAILGIPLGKYVYKKHPLRYEVSLSQNLSRQ